MADIVFLLDKLKNSKTPSESKISNYILSHKNEFLKMNIKELAQSANTSTAAIVRLCKRLSISGYSELKIEIAKEFYSTESDKEKEKFKQKLNFSPDASVSEIAKNVIEVTDNALHNLSKMIDKKALETVVKKLQHCRSIQIIGTGASGIVAKDLQQKFCRLGYLSTFNEDTELQTISACSLGVKDVVIAISYSGEHNAIIKSAEIAKKNNTYIVAITRFEKSTLSKLANVCLYVPDIESIYREGASLSRISQLVIIDILYQSLIISGYPNSKKLIDETWKAVQYNKQL